MRAPMTVPMNAWETCNAMQCNAMQCNAMHACVHACMHTYIHTYMTYIDRLPPLLLLFPSLYSAQGLDGINIEFAPHFGIFQDL